MIEQTTDFDIFQKLEFNRPLSGSHVQNLMDAIEYNSRLTEISPIIINEYNEVIDGQHRLEAHKRLARSGKIYPIYYIKRNGFNIKNAQQINSLNKVWGLIDFARIEAQSNPHYQMFIDAFETYKLPAQVVIVYLGGVSKRDSKLFKNGSFQVKDISKAEKYFSQLADIGYILQEGGFADVSFWKSVNFGIAMYNIFNYSNYSHERMKEMIKQRGDAIVSTKGRIADLEEVLKNVYNRGAEKKLRKNNK